LRVCAQQTAPAAPVVSNLAPRETDEGSSPDDEGHAAASLPSGCAVHASMIMHHAQAVEMTALIESHTENKDVKSAGRRISKVAVRRDKVHETVAGVPWTTNFGGGA